VNKAQAFIDQIHNPDAEFSNRLRMYRQMLLLFFGIYTALLFILYIVITKALPVSENVALIFANAIIIIVKLSTIFFIVGYILLFFLQYWVLWNLRKTGH
jgi:uncharacterized BrkB/YihY/UPF0761 family membrane protein